MTRTGVTSTALAALLVAHLAMPPAAGAQELVLGANVGAGSGVEGGDPGTGKMGFRKARTRVVGELEVRDNGDMKNGFGVVAFAEIEPSSSVGGGVRYLRFISPRFYGFAGLTGAIAPHTLFGGELGAQLQIPLGSLLGVFIEPSFAALPFGTDLPQEHVLVWGLVTVGIHANL